MILFDNVDDSLKPQMVQVRSDLNTSSNAPETPPPYSSSEQITPMQATDPEPVEGEQASHHGQPRDKSSRRRRKIIRRSLTGLCLMIIWILMAIIGPIISRKAGYIDTFERVPDILHGSPRRNDSNDNGQPTIPYNSEQNPHAIADPAVPDALRSFCIKDAPWTETISHSADSIPYFSADVSFQISADSEQLFLVSRAAHSSGRVQIIDSAIADDVVRVYVTMRSSNPETAKNTMACLMQRLPGVTGVGIFGSNAEYRPIIADTTDFDILVLLPPTASDTPRYYNLETDLPMFAHDVKSEAQFGFLSIKSSGMPLHFDALQAARAHIETSNASIEGAFNIASVLSISTSEHPINVNVTLDNVHNFPSYLRVKNTDGSIETSLALVSSSDTKPTFDVEITGKNSPVKSTVTEIPGGANLQLEIKTTQEPVALALPYSFEGSYILSSSAGNTPLVQQREHEDELPKRRLDITKKEDEDDGSETLEGLVTFVQTTNGDVFTEGTVYVRTSDASNTLIL
ncbi:hypothetical protein VKT23_000478 [Stygiomarasmius scandens]|uniref:DUF7330 domain-containing protein n=1 Tax=Marasmiellus scandens TaxID=2682957 RepID=A0ABR1K471_9AGAR